MICTPRCSQASAPGNGSAGTAPNGAASDWLAVELANLRAAYRWSFGRGQIEVATDVAAHAALIGTTVQQFETIAWAEELVPAATEADVARLPRLCTGAGYACFAGRPVSAAEHAHKATVLETRPEYDPCEPGLAMFVEALARVYSGDLCPLATGWFSSTPSPYRYAALSEQVARLPFGAGVWPASPRRRTAGVGPCRRGPGDHRGIRCGSPKGR